jgi:hypothetical protein
MGGTGWGGNLQTDAAQLFLFVPIPAKAKKLGLLSIYKFSLSKLYWRHIGRLRNRGNLLTGEGGKGGGRGAKSYDRKKALSISFNPLCHILNVYHSNGTHTAAYL